MAIPTYLLPLVGGGLGAGGFVWAIVNFRRDDTGKVIAQTVEIVTMLRGLIDELENALERSEARGVATAQELAKERELTKRLRLELDDVYAQLKALGGGRTDAR